MAAAWDGIKVLDVRQSVDAGTRSANEPYRVEITLDTNGLGRDLGIEQVAYRYEDGQESLHSVRPFKVVKEEGSIVTFELSARTKDAGIFKYGYRIFPNNEALPHRQDFAFTRWI